MNNKEKLEEMKQKISYNMATLLSTLMLFLLQKNPLKLQKNII